MSNLQPDSLLELQKKENDLCQQQPLNVGVQPETQMATPGVKYKQNEDSSSPNVYDEAQGNDKMVLFKEKMSKDPKMKKMMIGGGIGLIVLIIIIVIAASGPEPKEEMIKMLRESGIKWPQGDDKNITLQQFDILRAPMNKINHKELGFSDISKSIRFRLKMLAQFSPEQLEIADAYYTSLHGNSGETISGLTCQNWLLDSPHKKERGAVDDAEGSDGDTNQCFNPSKKYIKRTSDWCYTTDPDIMWEYCLPIDPLEKLWGKKGRFYFGNQTKTRNGSSCYTGEVNKQNSAVTTSSGVCRNNDPSNSKKTIWCYTSSDGEFDYCNSL